MFIRDILTIDLSEDIKSVIDLEDISEISVQSEIENYIITDGLAKEYESFVNKYTSNIIETGVWLSGFYGSGKSYFGKLLGYLLSNKKINGVPARDRILQRFTGIENEALVKNAIQRLNTQSTRVVFLDIAKQVNDKKFAYTLFKNFLKSIELPDNEHGYLLFLGLCSSKCRTVYDAIPEWKEIKNDKFQFIPRIKELFFATQTGKLESDYQEMLTTIRGSIENFDANGLHNELANYLKIVPDEKVIFLFDETSEAINQNKFSLLDLEGVSEALSALGGKVWTIAIAQEKLDDVISNKNVTKAQLTKVTDRFKTKIHLESTEVDVIIRSRLLKKKQEAIEQLKEHFQNNSGKIVEHSGLIGAAKTENADAYATYYPFYQNQFGLIQNFLFGSKGTTSTKTATRGMIITTYDILKREIQNEELYRVVAGWQITKEAQPMPPARLINRYENAEQLLKNENINLSGRRLLETLHFLTEAEITPTTVSNIVKSYVKIPDELHDTQPLIAKALNHLVEHKILLVSNGAYRITSDIEQRLLDEMKQFAVQVFNKKKLIISAYENSIFVKNLSKISDNHSFYDFFITSDTDDELSKSQLKLLKLKIKSLYNFSDDRSSDIEALKKEFEAKKDTLWLVPDNSAFKEIDKLLEEVERIKYLEDKYQSNDRDEAPIVKVFRAERSQKEKRISELVELSLTMGTAIYLYKTVSLDKNNWLATLNDLQRKVIQNVYSQRLAAQLQDTLAETIIKQTSNDKLHKLFAQLAADFCFFDEQGAFIGESLKPAEQILQKLKNNFIDGATLEKELEQPPTGFSYGTVVSTVAALMRGGKIIAKHNGTEKYSYKDEGVVAIFANSKEFRKAAFKAVAKTLSSAQKNQLVTILKELNCAEFTGKKIDWNTNDFELATAIKELAKKFCDKVDEMKRNNRDFDSLFSSLQERQETLAHFTGAVSEANYLNKAEDFLAQSAAYVQAIQEIEKAEKFVFNSLNKLRKWKLFTEKALDELNKAAHSNAAILPFIAKFEQLYAANVVENFKDLEETAQKVRDAYYQLMKEAAQKMSALYLPLEKDAQRLIDEIKALPQGLNATQLKKAESILQYAKQRTSPEVQNHFDVQDQTTKFTYSEMLSFIELFQTKKTDLEIAENSLIRTEPPKSYAPEKNETNVVSESQPVFQKTYSARLPAKKMKVGVYKQWLHQELQKLAAAADQDDIEINP